MYHEGKEIVLPVGLVLFCQCPPFLVLGLGYIIRVLPVARHFREVTADLITHMALICDLCVQFL
jgi:hypothetical protein